MNLIKIILFFFCTSFISSCTQTLDFNQADNFSVSPAYTSPLVSFKLASTEFIDSDTGIEVVTLEETADFKIFENSFFRDNLVKVVFNFELKNKLNKDVILRAKFLDQNNAVVYQFDQLYVPSKDLNFTHEEIIQGVDVQNFIRSVETNFAIDLVSSTTPLDSSGVNSLDLKSSITLYLDIQ